MQRAAVAAGERGCALWGARYAVRMAGNGGSVAWWQTPAGRAYGGTVAAILVVVCLTPLLRNTPVEVGLVVLVALVAVWRFSVLARRFGVPGSPK